MSKMLLCNEVADLIHVGRITIRKWTCEGKIPHVHLSPRCVRYPEDLIREWIVGKTHVAESYEAAKQIKPTRKKKFRRRNAAFGGEVDTIIERVKREVMG